MATILDRVNQNVLGMQGDRSLTFWWRTTKLNIGLSCPFLDCNKVTTSTETPEWKRWVPGTTVLCAWVALLVVFFATYTSTFAWLARMWKGPDYNHSFFVIPFSLFLLWFRRDMMDPFPTKGSWWALPFFALGAGIRGAAIYFNYSIDHYSLFPLLIGLALLVGGWRGLRWAWPAILFLVFMIPLPGFLEGALSRPLQSIGTNFSIYVIQTLGIPAVAMGNRIQLAAQALEVADACSGIRMLMLFFAICVGATLLMRLEIWEKCVIVASAIPIAVLSNVAAHYGLGNRERYVWPVGREDCSRLRRPGHDAVGHVFGVGRDAVDLEIAD